MSYLPPLATRSIRRARSTSVSFAPWKTLSAQTPPVTVRPAPYVNIVVGCGLTALELVALMAAFY